MSASIETLKNNIIILTQPLVICKMMGRYLILNILSEKRTNNNFGNIIHKLIIIMCNNVVKR